MGRLRQLQARPGARRRWAVVLVVVGALVATPAVLAARPVHPADVDTVTLLARVRASADLPYEGFVETTGRLAFPDLSQFGDTTTLLSATSRIRVWSASADHYRVDVLSTAGEHDFYRDGSGGFEWNSSHRTAAVIRRYPRVRLPSAPMVVPPALGIRMLDGVPASAVQRIAPKRIAGRAAIGLRVVEADRRSLVDHVDVWVDPGNGLPLAVSIVPRGDASSAFGSRFLDLALRTPSAARLAFDPERDPTATPAPGSEQLIEGTGNKRPLPGVVDGLRKRSVARDGTATYGDRFTIIAVAPVGEPLADAVRFNLDSPTRPPVTGGFGEGSEVLTPLVTALAFAKGDDGFLMVGSVDRATMERAATDLARTAR